MCWAFGVEGVQNLARFTVPTEIQELIPNKRVALRVFAYCLLYYVLTVGNNTIMIARLDKPIERSEFPYCTLGVILYYVQ